MRACRRAGVAAGQVDAVRDGLVIVALDEEARRLAASIDPPLLRTLDAIHLGTALSLREELEAMVTYDARLAGAAGEAGLAASSPA